MTPPASHRCDEFPAEYSSASCSPALLASVSSTALMLQQQPFVRRTKLSERHLGNFRTVSLQGVTSRTGNLGAKKSGTLSRALDYLFA